MQLEMLEMELIKKLQNTQAIQKQAYSDLESALAQPSAVVGSSEKKKQVAGIKGPSGGGNTQTNFE